MSSKGITKFAAIICLSTIIAAQSAPTKPTAAAGSSASSPAGFRADVLDELKDLQEKTVSLAGAVPQEKYSWRPAEGVRSIGEVFLHVAVANFHVAHLLGKKVPAGIDLRTLEKSKADKSKTVEVLNSSFGQFREAILDTPDPDLTKTLKVFGEDKSIRATMFSFVVHQSEHLGQSIAYARSNAVVPPWTQRREDAKKDKEKQKSGPPKP